MPPARLLNFKDWDAAPANTAPGRALSCEGCRRRKMRCSKTYPCTSCEMRDEPCEWRGPLPRQSGADAELEQAQQEVRRLRKLVDMLMVRLAEVGDETAIYHVPSASTSTSSYNLMSHGSSSYPYNSSSSSQTSYGGVPGLSYLQGMSNLTTYGEPSSFRSNSSDDSMSSYTASDDWHRSSMTSSGDWPDAGPFLTSSSSRPGDIVVGSSGADHASGFNLSHYHLL